MADACASHRGEEEDAAAAAEQVSHCQLLPIANVGRIMKQGLPSNAKISKEAKETMQECVSEFIAFVTGEASDRCRTERRKTLTGDDVRSALTTLGFDQYAHALKRYLQLYRDLEDNKSAAVVGEKERRQQPSQSQHLPDNGSNEQMVGFPGGMGRGDSSSGFGQQF